jgi:hypothetical protein
LAHEAEQVLRAILLWHVERTDRPEALQCVLEDLDLAMVEGGHAWALGARTEYRDSSP